MAGSFSIKTLGCKLNQYESSLIAHQLKRHGWVVKPFGEQVDVVIVNTCTVTDRSDKKCRNYIRQGSRFSRCGGTVVTGCLAERDPGGLRSMPQVREVYGNDDKTVLHLKLEELIAEDRGTACDRDHKERCEAEGAVHSFHDADDAWPLPLDHTRGFLKIQDGCDGICSYCVVPSVRGAPRSRDLGEVLHHAEVLVDNGCPELVLSGITIGKYRSGGTDLAGLVVKLQRIPGDFRVRITSIEPNHITPELIGMLGRDRVCGHIHIPVQSGSDRILERMRRPYSVNQLKHIIDSIRTHNEDIAIGSDMIVGFPGESDEDFNMSLDIVGWSGFSYVHQFTFSPREGTPAASTGKPVPPAVTARRAALLKKLSRETGLRYRKRFEGRVLPSVIEYGREYGVFTAVSDNYIKMKLGFSPDPTAFEGKIVGVKLKDAGTDSNSGAIVF